MLNANDKENFVKSSQTANLLVQDLRELAQDELHWQSVGYS